MLKLEKPLPPGGFWYEKELGALADHCSTMREMLWKMLYPLCAMIICFQRKLLVR